MKLTASTITTASISTLTNSPTERDTASGWSCTCSSSMPSGRSALTSVAAARRLRPSRMMSPPLAMDTPSATT